MAQLKINPGLRMVEFAAGSVQFGLGAGGLVLEGTGEPDRQFLRRLRQGFDASDLDAVRAGCGLEVGPGRFAAGGVGSGAGAGSRRGTLVRFARGPAGPGRAPLVRGLLG